MLMPKAAVHENHFSTRRKHQVRFAGKVPLVESIAVAESVDESPNEQFGLHALASDRAHVPAAPGRTQLVHLGEGSRPARCLFDQPIKTPKFTQSSVLSQSIANQLRREVDCGGDRRIWMRWAV